MIDQYIFNEILEHFDFKGQLTEIRGNSIGHINDTYTVSYRQADGSMKKYILQRINTSVFREPEKLMENIENVTGFLRTKIAAAGGNPNRETLNLIKSIDGKAYYKSKNSEYWRSYDFIEGARTYQVVENLNHFYHAGKVLGKFELMLKDFPAEKLHETIPDFHNTPKRFKDFIRAVEEDRMNRTKYVKEEILFVLARAQEMDLLVKDLKEGKLPLRVTHNDTKFNNIMLDCETGEGVCIVDLDTIMPGLSLYDFGDSIRSGANPAEEDEKDLSKVCLDLKLFENFTRGFLEGVNKSLTDLELEYLPYSAKLMTLECGMRFLTDHLNGDIYFKIYRKNHNLDRARTQFKMVKDMEDKFDKMKAIVDKYK